MPPIKIKTVETTTAELMRDTLTGVAVTSVNTYALPKGRGTVYARIYSLRDQAHADAFTSGKGEPDLQGHYMSPDLARQFAAMLLTAADLADAQSGKTN